MSLSNRTKEITLIALADKKAGNELVQMIETNASDTEWSDPINANLIPEITNTFDIGSPSKKFKDIYVKKGFFCEGNGTFSQSDAGIIAGFSNAGGVIEASFKGAEAAGYASGSNAAITASGAGSSASGQATSGGNILASGAGSIAVGRALDGGYGYTATIQAQGNGAFAFGFVESYYGDSSIDAGQKGTFAGGEITSGEAGSTIQASQLGSFAHGSVQGFGYLKATNAGAFAQGRALAGKILASGIGSHSSGFATGASANLTASGEGSFAHGKASGTNDISAAGDGALAIGDASNGLISAVAQNSAQFGPGTNGLADSVQVGAAGLRFKGTSGAPGAPQNGDFWIDNSYVYIQSNGVAVKIS